VDLVVVVVVAEDMQDLVDMVVDHLVIMVVDRQDIMVVACWEVRMVDPQDT